MVEIEEIQKLKQIFDNEIYSIVKYGFGKRNILVVLKDGFNIAYLMKIKPFIRKLKKNNNIVVVSRKSLITNNIDILNIKLTSATIYGPDVFKGMEFDTSKIKKQIEYEANKTLINLKNDLLSKKWSWEQKKLLFSSIPRMLPLIIAHLYVKGDKIPNAIPDTINKYVKHNPDAAVLLRIRRDISNDQLIKFYDELFHLLQGLAEKV